jgi:hypothetical protein
MRYDAINQEINTTEWTAITLGSGQICDAYAVQVRDGSGCLLKKTADAETYWTVFGREKVILSEARGVPGDILCYAKAITGTPVVEVMISRG